MAYSMQQAQADTEIWLNTAPGMRWFKALDLYGRETTKTVSGGRTFTLTIFERQLNQANVASAEQDLFRNGTFSLRKPAEATNEEEVRSPNSLTEAEVSGLVVELMHGEVDVATALAGVSSDVTFNRIIEAMVLEDAPPGLIGQVKALKTGDAKEASVPLPPTEPVVTKPEEPEDEFDAIKGEAVMAELKDES